MLLCSDFFRTATVDSTLDNADIPWEKEIEKAQNLVTKRVPVRSPEQTAARPKIVFLCID